MSAAVARLAPPRIAAGRAAGRFPGYGRFPPPTDWSPRQGLANPDLGYELRQSVLPPGLRCAAKVEDMCGRYASARQRIELLEEFSVERDRVTEPLEPDYNVAPTKPVYAVLTRRPRTDERPADPADSAEPQQETPADDVPQRELRVVRWG